MIMNRPKIAGFAAMAGITALALITVTSFKLMSSYGGIIYKLENSSGPIQRDPLLEICNATHYLMGVIIVLSGISILSIVVMCILLRDRLTFFGNNNYKKNDILAGTQQVDSAEASTIAVPPSDLSGSPR
jgi:DMSO/TMAO reductase YedYZ heme-binding membrane subunit